MILKNTKRSLVRVNRGLNRLLGIKSPPPENSFQQIEPAHLRAGSIAYSCAQHTIIIIDCSGSMGIADCKPHRHAAAKKAAGQYVMKRKEICTDDRIAVIGFNTKARIYLPLTSIVNWGLILKSLKKIKFRGGTDIATGLRKAQKLFEETVADSHFHRILLLTDGQGGDPLSVAFELKAQGVTIEVIGIGRESKSVNETVLRSVATTDEKGFTHYWFIQDSEKLISQFEQLATGIVFRRQ